ncbi:MAG TPA: heat-inducible transcriptional repressor HrcA [Geminicoccaceae bacterium]|nr:heat-inducible transcriptional repressor HrcA [Geminicoccaceae bacterium]
MITELNERSREIFRQIVDGYVLTGEPVGSRTISRRLSAPLSPATIRNVMADLEEAGLLYAPHTSAGRVPTDAGLRLYVDGLLEVGNLTEEERRTIDGQCAGAGRGVQEVLSDATDALSNLSHFAGLVLAPKSERPFRHVELVPLSPGRALVVVVADNGMVENRVIEVPVGMSSATLIEAGNYLTARLAGRNLGEARELIRREIEERRSQLDRLSQQVVQAGLAMWANDNGRERDEGVLIVRGQANLLNDVTKLADLERLRALFEALETKKNLLRVIELLQAAEGVQLYIGAENELFGLSGCSMVIAPYGAGGDEGAHGGSKVVGAIGVIGPTRMNYARIIPMVDYTARVVSRLLGRPDVEMRT